MRTNMFYVLPQEKLVLNIAATFGARKKFQMPKELVLWCWYSHLLLGEQNLSALSKTLDQPSTMLLGIKLFI